MENTAGLVAPAAAAPAGLILEANAALAGAPVDQSAAPVETGPPPAAQMAEGYTVLCAAVVAAAANGLAPAWQVTPAETQSLAGAMAQALVLWFPDQVIPAKYMALLAVAGVSFEIISARRLPSGGLRPRFPEPETREQASAN